MLTPLIATLQRLFRRKPAPPPALPRHRAEPRGPAASSVPPAAPAPFPEDLAMRWREEQLANARQAKPLNFSQLVSRIKREPGHPLYAVGIHTLRRHMMVIDPRRLQASEPSGDEASSSETSAFAPARPPAPAPMPMPATDVAPTDAGRASGAGLSAPPLPAIEDPSCAAVTLLAWQPWPTSFDPGSLGPTQLQPPASTAHTTRCDENDDDIDVLHFLKTYRRPVIEPSERFKWLDEPQPERFRPDDEIIYL